MSTATQPGPALRPELDRLLDRLRRRIRGYTLVEGTALVLATAAGLFLGMGALDWAWFRLTNQELPVAVRAVIDVVAVSLLVAAATTYLLFRLMKQLKPGSLALILERRFPELDDRLVLAVERAERLAHAPDDPVTEAMRRRATDGVAEAADRLDVADVFDRRPLRRAVLAAAVLLAPIVLMAVLAPAALATWWDAYGRLEPTYHARDTQLMLTALAPPDSRPRPLTPGEPYKHPRGATLSLLIDVPEGDRPDGKAWVVPESVYASRRNASGGRGTSPAVKAGDRRFRLSIDEVRDSLDLWVTGGDYTNAAPFRIEVVDPPRVERVELRNLYPTYTRLTPTAADGTPQPDVVPLAGAVAEVPQGTWTALKLRSNKPIRNARVRLGEQELEIGEFDAADGGAETRGLFVGGGTADRPASSAPLPPGVADGLIDADRMGLTIPVRLGHTPDAGGFRMNGPPGPAGGFVIDLPPETAVRVTLEDADRVASLDPARFDLRGVPDTPPEVKTATRGVSDIITRTAVVPVRGTVRDDHGIAAAGFEYRIDEAEDWQPKSFSNPPAGLPKELTLRRGPETPAEWFDTATLNLTLGQTLTLAVAASDADDLTGPHRTRGEPFAFKIVTREELLATLYNQEVNLRKRFEQSFGEIKAMRADLADHRDRAAAIVAGTAAPTDAQAVRSAADRAATETQQNANETAAVEASFGEILEQLVNNRVHTENQLDRIRTGILDPLGRLTGQRFPRLDRAIGELRLRIADGENPLAAFDASLEAADAVVAEMEAALKEMQDLAEFHEAIQDLSAIFESEEKLLDRTAEEQKRSVIDSLGDLLD